MTCDTCGGLIISQWDDHRVEQKCVNCGRSPKTMANSTPRPEPGLRAAPARPPTVEEMVPTLRCTKRKCDEPAAEDSVMCEMHRDQKRRANAKAQGRPIPEGITPGKPGRKPGRPSAQTAQPKKPGSALASPEEARRLGADIQADRSMTTEEKTKTATAIFPAGTNEPAFDWNQWKAEVIIQLIDAEEKLILKLTSVQAAKASIEAL